jgi:hypothetical protein
MRHIALGLFYSSLFQTEDGARIRAGLDAEEQALAVVPADLRSAHIKNNGPRKWSPLKTKLEEEFGKKCWYTEALVIGSDLEIDHFRPVSKYWYLAYRPDNYRISCAYANKRRKNAKYMQSGGKGTKFPLLDDAARATSESELVNEHPLLLDPLVESDCELLRFEADGVPKLNPLNSTDAIAATRVETSKLALNIDHPDFNSSREQLYHDIKTDVHSYEDLPATSTMRNEKRDRLRSRIEAAAPFSSAARTYLSMFRHLQWVQDLLDE